MHINELKIVGCGGHSKVVLDALSLLEHSLQITLCDKNPQLLGKVIGGLLVANTMDSLSDYYGLIHVAIGNNQIRTSICDAINARSSLYTVIHPAAIISKSASIGAGSFIAARAILGPETTVGEACIINHGAVVDHEVQIGAYSHIAPNSTLGGQVKVGKGVLLGSGSIVLPGITIGDGAVIASGAVVIRDVKENTLVKGIPAV